MSRKSEPQLTSWKQEDFTKITFKPDLAKFGMDSFDDDIESLFKKRVYDLAGCIPGVKVFLNDERIKIKGFRPYIDMYLKDSPEVEGSGTKHPIIHQVVNDRWEIAFTISDGQFQQVSFVNSISTSKGGTHVNHVADQIVTRLLEHIKKKNKSVNLKPFQVKSHLSLFVNCLIENPSFDSQTKENMTLRASAFGSKCDLDEEFYKKIMKSGVLESKSIH